MLRRAVLDSFGGNPPDYLVPDDYDGPCDDSLGGGSRWARCRSRAADLYQTCAKTIECRQGQFCMAVEGGGYCEDIWADE